MIGQEDENLSAFESSLAAHQQEEQRKVEEEQQKLSGDQAWDEYQKNRREIEATEAERVYSAELDRIEGVKSRMDSQLGDTPVKELPTVARHAYEDTEAHLKGLSDSFPETDEGERDLRDPELLEKTAQELKQRNAELSQDPHVAEKLAEEDKKEKEALEKLTEKEQTLFERDSDLLRSQWVGRHNHDNERYVINDTKNGVFDDIARTFIRETMAICSRETYADDYDNLTIEQRSRIVDLVWQEHSGLSSYEQYRQSQRLSQSREPHVYQPKTNLEFRLHNNLRFMRGFFSSEPGYKNSVTEASVKEITDHLGSLNIIKLAIESDKKEKEGCSNLRALYRVGASSNFGEEIEDDSSWEKISEKFGLEIIDGVMVPKSMDQEDKSNYVEALLPHKEHMEALKQTERERKESERVSQLKRYENTSLTIKLEEESKQIERTTLELQKSLRTTGEDLRDKAYKLKSIPEKTGSLIKRANPEFRSLQTLVDRLQGHLRTLEDEIASLAQRQQEVTSAWRSAKDESYVSLYNNPITLEDSERQAEKLGSIRYN